MSTDEGNINARSKYEGMSSVTFVWKNNFFTVHIKWLSFGVSIDFDLRIKIFPVKNPYWPFTCGQIASDF